MSNPYSDRRLAVKRDRSMMPKGMLASSFRPLFNSPKSCWRTVIFSSVVSMLLIILWLSWPAESPPGYQWGSYRGCPNSWINQNDPDWEQNPLLHLQGGQKTEVVWAKEHLIACGVPFVRNADQREELIEDGGLRKLEGPYLVLRDVSEPYVTPLMNRFANRLSQQYYEAGFGKLVFTSALRNQVSQAKLSNGSRHSAHSTGMTVDLAVPTNTSARIWLQSVLLKIERDGRIDVTQELSPAHFHITLIPWTYESWLMEELGVRLPYDPEEVRALTTAIYFESAVDEPVAGIQAIASVIKNRRDSSEFPDTIQAVVAEGAGGKENGGCQFSFMCDGLPEQPRIVCNMHPRDTTRAWGNDFPCARRWAAYYQLARQFLVGSDTTNGAVLYYTGQKPYWADSDMISPVRIGSHIFGCSRYRGSDVCT